MVYVIVCGSVCVVLPAALVIVATVLNSKRRIRP